MGRLGQRGVFFEMHELTFASNWARIGGQGAGSGSLTCSVFKKFVLQCMYGSVCVLLDKDGTFVGHRKLGLFLE